MERLTERKRNYDRTGISKKSLIVEEGIRKGTPSSYCVAIVTKLADLEDSLEQGKLIELPCKPGDTVYVLRKSRDGLKVDKKEFMYGMLGMIGGTVFLTEKEALEALEGIKHEKA